MSRRRDAAGWAGGGRTEAATDERRDENFGFGGRVHKIRSYLTTWVLVLIDIILSQKARNSFEICSSSADPTTYVLDPKTTFRTIISNCRTNVIPPSVGISIDCWQVFKSCNFKQQRRRRITVGIGTSAGRHSYRLLA